MAEIFKSIHSSFKSTCLCMMMMAFLRSCKSSKGYVSISRGLFYSTETSIIQEKHISKKNDNLYRRISPVGDPNVSMIPILEQWEKEGKSVKFKQLIDMIKSLRKFNRYTHALQLSDWMFKKTSKLNPAGVAVHLDLLSRVHGLEQAENYFNTIPEEVKNFQVYGALLNCYASTKSLEKAEALIEKMKQMGMMTTLSYNSMLNLYKKTENRQKLDETYQEMLETGISCDKQTYYIRLSAHASVSDIQGMEKVLKKMEEGSGLTVDWNAYIIAAGGYLKSGTPEKSYEMLKKSEECIRGNSKGAAWEILIRMYSSLGKKDDVYRIWDLYKTSWSKVYNRGYSSIINALVKLDDIEGAEKMLTEWESQNLSFDFRIPNMVIGAYCKKGILGKAEEYVERVEGMGKVAPASTWGLFVAAYVRDNEMEKAVEVLKKCVDCEDKRGCRFDEDIFGKCVEYLKGKGDLELVEEIKRNFEGRIRGQRISDGDEGFESGDFEGIEESNR
ncbi:hypothetical protein L2E82_41709 [Cichorium intybus]|uniref:Uncharacterized protein n=1 Tax=Cichorium intybus TaxID=13427 RepID=A0ACB8ZLZ9_CICIN|nr:hypothetical protein L2E82_41709 [Cichorium intybus]